MYGIGVSLTISRGHSLSRVRNMRTSGVNVNGPKVKLCHLSVAFGHAPRGQAGLRHRLVPRDPAIESFVKNSPSR